MAIALTLVAVVIVAASPLVQLGKPRGRGMKPIGNISHQKSENKLFTVRSFDQGAIIRAFEG